jgi:hypothetical protein
VAGVVDGVDALAGVVVEMGVGEAEAAEQTDALVEQRALDADDGDRRRRSNWSWRL